MPAVDTYFNIRVGDTALECLHLPAQRLGQPTLVLLHEGLGCCAMWRDFPQRLNRLTGAAVFAYSRAGYGGSSPIALPRPLDYMHREAVDVLPFVLAAVGSERHVLLGHSDGASIALIYASQIADAALSGLIAIAPHVFVEALGVDSIRAARAAFDGADLRPRLQKYHGRNVDCAFRGWCDAWLDPGFRAWNIEAGLVDIRVPMLLLQGQEDPYGTTAQLRRIRRHLAGPVQQETIAGAGHTPQRDRPEIVDRLIADFMRRCASVR